MEKIKNCLKKLLSNEIEEKQYEIRKETLIDIPHDGKIITFVYGRHGPGTYVDVKGFIEKANLACPIMAETASFVYTTFFSDKHGFYKIKKIMKKRWLWAFTGILYVPDKGVYIQDNPEIRNSEPFMDESELVKKLEAKDPDVRFVPFGFKVGEMSPIKLARNKYVIALAGEEGAEKLAEVANEHESKPYLWSFKSVDQPLMRVSALDSVWGLDGWLGIDGNIRSYDGIGGCAFGIKK